MLSLVHFEFISIYTIATIKPKIESLTYHAISVQNGGVLQKKYCTDSGIDCKDTICPEQAQGVPIPSLVAPSTLSWLCWPGHRGMELWHYIFLAPAAIPAHLPGRGTNSPLADLSSPHAVTGDVDSPHGSKAVLPTDQCPM